MKKLAIILVFLVTTAYAKSGSKYEHSELSPKLDDEVSNIYEESDKTRNDLRNFRDSSSQNILINGGFDFWQRGTSFSAPADSIYTADRWMTNTSEAANVTVTKETTIVGSGASSMKVAITAAGASTRWFIGQSIENVVALRGKTITLTMRVNSNVAGKIRILITDGTSNGYSEYHSGSGSFETLTCAITVSQSATTLYAYAGMIAVGEKATGTYYFDDAMLTIGQKAVLFVPKDPAAELIQCQRYYQRIGGNIALEQISTGMSYSATNWITGILLPVRMRVAPTVTVTGATIFRVYDAGATAVACATVLVTAISPMSVQIYGTVAAGLAAGDATILTANTTGAYLELSAEL